MSLIKEIIPPVLHRALWRFRNRHLRRYRPELCAIAAGPAQGIRLHLDLEHSSEQALMAGGEYDRDLLAQIASLPLHETTLFDVGSHIGFYALFFARLCGSRGQVVALEPNPANYARLQTNLTANPELAAHVTALHSAAAEKEGELTLNCSLNIDDGTSSGSHLEVARPPLAATHYEMAGYRKVQVRAQSLDNIWEQLPNSTPSVSFIKIDVEGAEHHVLLGASRLIEIHRPIMLVEVHTIKAMFLVKSWAGDHNYHLTIAHEESDGRLTLLCKRRQRNQTLNCY